MIDVADILNGIREEIRSTPNYVDFHVNSCSAEGSLWRVFISADDKGRNELDESLEGARVWWKGTPPGTAEVLSVVPDESQINLRFASKSPPPAGETIRIYLPQYLEKLEDVWSDDSWADRCVRWLTNLEDRNPRSNSKMLESGEFSWLRKAQREAFDLTAWSISFLHGPPGTGKTRTLGALIAQYLCTFREDRVLLLSTTNVAVDEAITAVDSALTEIPTPISRKIRFEQCKRVGNHFIASKYRGRDHLLPKQDTALLERLIKLEALRPREEDLKAYSTWKQQVEDLRAQMRTSAAKSLTESRLAAMTTTRAVFGFEDLRTLFAADLIVFDESSQVGLAHALALAPLGRRCLFTGDPQQLAPICRSEVDDAKEWLGQSMFAKADAFADAMCFLDEQSRMAEPICHIVSKTFYDGKLKVATKCGPDWVKERHIGDSRIEKQSVSIRRIPTDHKYSQKYGGWIRFESAQVVCETTQQLLREPDASEIIILTPFRAQRRLIKSFLKNAGIRGVRISTVHRAQGSECHTVIFDPVGGSLPFLNTDDAPRLINVAFSRAKARLILCLSADDLKNPILQKVNSVATNLAGILQNEGFRVGKGQRKRHASLILDSGFPLNAINKEISISSKRGDIVGKVREASADGKEFSLFVYATGEIKKFRTEFVRNNAGGV